MQEGTRCMPAPPHRLQHHNANCGDDYDDDGNNPHIYIVHYTFSNAFKGIISLYYCAITR